MSVLLPDNEEWCAKVTEDIVEPDRRIIDPHHHLGYSAEGGAYLINSLWQDTGSGDCVEKTVFIECQTNYRERGPERCMFESNFPMERHSISYQVLWNTFKKIVADFSEAEKHALFYGTAERLYRLG